MKPLVFILLALLVVPTLAHSYTVWENSSVIITTTNGTDLRNVTTLNLSFYYTNLSTVWRAGELVSPTIDGIYIDYVIFNASGSYIAIADINDTGTVYRRFIYLTVEENNDMLLSITLSLIFLTILGFYLAKDAYSKPTISTNKPPNELWHFKDWGALYMGISILSVVILFGFMSIATDNSPYDELMNTTFIVIALLFGMFAILYVWYFFSYRWNEGIQWQKGRGR